MTSCGCPGVRILSRLLTGFSLLRASAGRGLVWSHQRSPSISFRLDSGRWKEYTPAFVSALRNTA